jgi:hypothetical protein
MARRIALPGLAAAIVLAAGCTDTPSFRKDRFAPIPGLQPGDTPERVKEVLKADPVRREDGYWLDSNRFEMGLQVWHYRGVGRVVFDRMDMRVRLSEADARE